VCSLNTPEQWTHNENWAEKKEQEKNDRYSSHLGFINHLSNREKSGWKTSQTNFATGVRGSLHTNQFQSLGVKNKNTREAIRKITVQRTLSMSDIILKFFLVALNPKTEWTLQTLPAEIANKNMKRFNLHLQPSRMWTDHIASHRKRSSNWLQSSAYSSTLFRSGCKTYSQKTVNAGY